MAQKDCWRTIAVCLVLVAGTVALYSPVLHFGFVNLGDEIYIAGNPHVRGGLTGGDLAWAFGATYASNWHPLTWTSHMVDAQFFGARAGRHHATSLALHALNSALLFLILRRMTGFFWRSAAVAAFFAWHPLHVESVAWLAERKDVLSGFFCLLTLWAYVRYTEGAKARTAGSKWFYGLALALFALGLMAKPMLVTVPFVLLLIDWWPLGRLGVGAKGPGAPGIGPVLMEKAPFFVLSAASCVITVIAAHQEAVTSMVAGLPYRLRIVTAGVSYFRYLEKTVWPSDLGVSYPFAIHRPKLELIGIAAVLVGVTVFAFCARKSRPYWLVGWLWFVGMLIPTLNLVWPVAQPMADRYMYLPSIGLFILICWDAAESAAEWPRGRTALGAVAGVALAACCVVSWFQIHYWRSEGALLSRIPQPELNFTGHANFASFLLGRGQLPLAQTECEKAVSILPGYAPFHAELGEILVAEGKFDEAIEQFRMVEKRDPRLVGIHLPWGRALLGQKHVEAAEAEFRTVLDADPKSFEAHKSMGDAFMISGKTGAALEEFRASLNVQPNQPELLNNLAWFLATDPHADIRNGASAVKLATRACELTRGAVPAYLGTLAAAYAEEGRFDDAVKMAQRAHDTAAAEAAEAQKANQPAVARTLQALAGRNLELQAIYKNHQAFHEKAAK